jgi:hypothetical protein
MKTTTIKIDSKRTRENKAIAKVLLKIHYGNIRAMCRAANISKSRFYEWLEQDPEFDKAIKDIRFGIRDFAIAKIDTKVQNGDLNELLKLDRKMRRRQKKDNGDTIN